VTNLTQTKLETLQYFSGQLRSWCGERLQQQPGPFRQAELYQNIISEHKLTSPPIILWINRESFIAGGILVLPQNKDEDVFAAGTELAKIFGLPCFFSWGRHELSCWSTDYNPPEKTWEYELPYKDISSPATFRKSLNLLMDQMEASFFKHQQTSPTITPEHVVNLVHSTLTDLIPEVQQAIQIEQSSMTQMETSTIDLKNMLFRQLLLVMGLTACDIPHLTAPDRSATEVLTQAAEMMPASLQPIFEKHPTEPPFPKQCQRRLTHFVNRVQQLKKHLPGLITPLITTLLKEWAKELGGHQVQYEQTDLHKVIINPDTFDSTETAEYEIGPSGILAAIALARHFSTEDNFKGPRQFIDPLDLANKLDNHLVVGTLTDNRLPTATEQKKLNTFLRVSWPNHKLTLALKSPTWLWQFLHICGLAEGKSQIELKIPQSWLWERYGEKIPAILANKLFFAEISETNQNQLFCKLRVKQEDDMTTARLADGTFRQLKNVPAAFWRSQILIALKASDDIFHLVANNDLHFFEPEQCAKLSSTGLSNYMSSSLGRDFWRLLAPGRPFPKMENTAAECSRAGIPLPSEKILSALSKISSKSGPISTADLDQELAVWLGETAALPKEAKKARKPAKEPVAEEQTELFLRHCTAEEVPVFPDNYIYKTPADKRIEYSFSGHLTIIDSFFDETILQDQQQLRIKVKGTRQAEALSLISTCRSGPIELPCSQTETADMLDLYIQDLKKLRQAYYRHAVIYLPSDSIVKKVDDLWQKLPLPDWVQIKEK
jgi:hypothetical protein